MVLGTIILITNWIPKVASFKYEFQVGKPWKNESLIAPFDFAIKKSAEEIENEKKIIAESVHPYYSFNVDAVVNAKKQFTQDFSTAYKRSKEQYGLNNNDSIFNLKLGLKLLNDLYSKGIIEVNEQHIKPHDVVINVLKGNVAEISKISQFATIKQAFQYIIESVKKNENAHEDFLIPLIERSVQYNITFDMATTQKVTAEQLREISETRGMIQEGEIIVSKGTIIDKNKFSVLNSYKTEHEQRIGGGKTNYYISLGYFMLIAMMLILYSIYMWLFAPEVFYSNSRMSFVLLLIITMAYISHWAVKASLPSYYIIPYCIVPIVIRTFFGNRLALYTHTVIVLLCGFIIPESFVFILMQFMAGMVAVFSNIRTRYWSQFFVANALILLTYFIGYAGTSLIQQGSISNVEWNNFGWLSANVFLVLLAYPLVPIFEKIFGLISDITLVELADINKPLLKQLSIKAPGTFQHSLQVSNLAEAAANEIKANSLLVKVAALYHDIGKMENPIYFIENQVSDVNPHDELPFEESAQIIISHVIKGVELAQKYRLPDALIDFIRTHHGTSRVEYFYRSYLKNFPEEEVEESLFRYPGPKPFSKETAILMMADAVEATSRSLQKPNAEDIDKLVEKIVDYQIKEQQFVNCDITMKDITVSKNVFKSMLKSFYHVRIAYPDYK